MENSVVEGRPNIGHAPGRMGGVLPDQLHPGHRQLPVPELGGLVSKAQHGPLLVIGVPLCSRAYCALALTREAHTLTHQEYGDPGQGRLRVF